MSDETESAKPTSTRKALTRDKSLDTGGEAPSSPSSRNGSLGYRLYSGESGFDFLGARKIFYIISVVVVMATVGLLFGKGLNFGIDFVGGNTFEVPAAASQQNQVSAIVQDGLDKSNADLPSGEEPATIATTQVVGSGESTSILVKTSAVSKEHATAIRQALAEDLRPSIEQRLTAAGTEITDETVQAQVSAQSIAATWGADVSRQAVIALIVFLIVVSVFLRFRYQWGLVAGAMVALLHDLIVTAGIYALIGFEVTPATVIGMLTILGFSLYDTVVVFDKVDENTRPLLAGSRMTFSEAANLAINQTLMRSINTSVISLLPVAALLFVGAGILGVGTLKDLALVLMIGMAAGLYSSIFLAAPIAAEFAERRPEYIELARKVRARRERGTTKKPGNPSRKTSAKAKAQARKVATTEVVAREGQRTDGQATEGQATEVTGSAGSGTATQTERAPRVRSAGTAPKPGAKPHRGGKKK